MLDVQAALTSAKVPGYRDAFRPTTDVQEPPDVYCVYQITTIPTMYADDEAQAELVRVQLYLFSRNSPEATQAAIVDAMKAQTFNRKWSRDDYESDTDVYLVLSEWDGIRWLG